MHVFALLVVSRTGMGVTDIAMAEVHLVITEFLFAFAVATSTVLAVFFLHPYTSWLAISRTGQYSWPRT